MRGIRSILGKSQLTRTLQKSTTLTQQDPCIRLRPRSRLYGTNISDYDGDSSISSSDTSMRPDIAFILEHYRIHRREKEGGNGLSREYLLLPPDVYVPQVIQDPNLPAAALFAHRNILFGARSFHGYDMVDVCLPLVRAALEESEIVEHGQQPQAVASLNGLSEWVVKCLENDRYEGSQTLKRLAEHDVTSDDDGKGISVSLEAVRAIATGVPRPGHSVVGQGTFRDGEDAWKELAKEFSGLGLSKEINLYEKQGGNLINIEHLANRSPDNMKSAGGAMARLFFL
uniref:Uncharacterized protein n=1 Tax=Pseudo-nitzschia australis TaxID=44445 RepID=A0A7S4AXS9_9STRA|mmetsp:Transcript_1990/g.4324  ORF Transcript_1990/g.4324 Transcript_1990/m.4324 type:complete len:285 (+) Transcript_1990:53-907(+)